jgi:hypothetical protein
MKKTSITIILLMFLLLSCSKKDDDSNNNVSPQPNANAKMACLIDGNAWQSIDEQAIVIADTFTQKELNTLHVVGTSYSGLTSRQVNLIFFDTTGIQVGKSYRIDTLNLYASKAAFGQIDIETGDGIDYRAYSGELKMESMKDGFFSGTFFFEGIDRETGKKASITKGHFKDLKMP